MALQKSVLVLRVNELEARFVVLRALRFDEPGLDAKFADWVSNYDELFELVESGSKLEKRLSTLRDEFRKHFDTVVFQKALADRKKKREAAVSQ